MTYPLRMHNVHFSWIMYVQAFPFTPTVFSQERKFHFFSNIGFVLAYWVHCLTTIFNGGKVHARKRVSPDQSMRTAQRSQLMVVCCADIYLAM